VNSILFYPDELSLETTAALSPARSKEIIQRHKPAFGKWQSAIILGRSRAECCLEEHDGESLRFNIRAKLNEPAVLLPITAVVAISRPQTIKKILQSGAEFGVSKILLVRSEGVAKSYLQSKSLFRENIDRQIALGMEQGRNPFPPEVKIFTRLQDCFKELDTSESDQPRFIADTTVTANQTLRSYFAGRDDASSIVLAIGPESGWTERDRSLFAGELFAPVTLGANMLRIETAFSAGVGQASLFLSRADKDQL